MDHIAIKVSDLESAEKWYCEHLDAKVTFKDEKYIRIQVENTNIALIDEKHYPYPHIGILIENLTDLPLEKGGSCKTSRWNGRSLCKRPIWKLFRVIFGTRKSKKRYF